MSLRQYSEKNLREFWIKKSVFDVELVSAHACRPV